jgi:hypothetical protein
LETLKKLAASYPNMPAANALLLRGGLGRGTWNPLPFEGIICQSETDSWAGSWNFASPKAIAQGTDVRLMIVDAIAFVPASD